MAADQIADRLEGLDGIPHIAVQKLFQPEKILHIDGLIQSQRDLLRLDCRLGHAGPLEHGQRTARHAHDRVIDDRDADQDRDRD